MLTFRKIVDMYVDGFRSMTVGKKLWALIFIKMIIIFGILKVFFFPDVVSERAEATGADEADVVRMQILSRDTTDMMKQP